MAYTYTSNQTGAIAILLASGWWGIDHLGADIILGRLSASTLTGFYILLIILWILVPFYVKRIKWSYIVGMVLSIISIIGMVATPSTPAWYTFTEPMFNLSSLLAYLFAPAFIYFSYKSYREL